MNDHQNAASDQFDDTSQLADVTADMDATAHSNGNPHVSALAEGIGPRGPGSSAEEEAATYLSAALGALGLPAIRLPAHAPSIGGMQDIAFAIASLVALLAAVLLPPLGLVLVIALIGLTLADMYDRVRISDWLPARQSVNVLSIVPPAENEVRRLVVTATLDTGQVGLLSRKHWGFAYAWMHMLILASQILVALICVVLLFRDGDTLKWLFPIPAILLVGVLVLLGERELRGQRSPGAVTNASGVGALIDLAGKVLDKPPRWIEVWFLGAGASSTSNAGLRDFLRRNTFDPDTTYFVHLQSPGGGMPVIPRKSGAGLRSAPATPLLTWIFDSVRGDLIDTDTRTIHRLPFATQAFTTDRVGYQSIVVAGLDAQNRIPLLDDSEDLPYQVQDTCIDDTVRFVGAAIDALDREVAARAMLARSAASIQDTSENPVVAGDLPSDEE